MAEPPLSLRRPLGLVLSAGGSLASWQTAALRTLERRGLVFDSVLGFSAGALTGASYALGLLEDGLKRWRSLDGGVLKFSPRLFPFSLFSGRPVWDSVDYASDDEQAKARTRCRFVVASARLQRDSPIYAVFTPGGKEGWDAPLAAHLVASCAIPVIFPPIRLSFRGQAMTLFDGGVPCAEPFSFSALGPCRDVVILEMVRPDEVGRMGDGLLREVDQKARETVRRLINQGAASLKAQADPPRIFRLAPSRLLDFMMLSFRPEDIAASLALGERDAEAFLREPKNYLEQSWPEKSPA